MKTKMSNQYLLLQKIIQILGIIALIGSIFLVIWLYRLGIMNDSNALKDFVHKYKFWGPFVFVLIQIFQVVFPIIPGGVTTVAGQLIFGPWLGFIYNYIGICLGSIILFWLVKVYGKKFILLFVKEKNFYDYERRLETPGFEKIFIICMISPISPADIMVMIMGLSNMTIKRLTAIILITKPLSIIGYSYLWIFGGDIVRLFLK
ncbi:MAG: TVP38/TMEM64 family protein [Streptococcus sp.]|nr:TVP38/TMEM64 family protein [Streptococcus sp.]